MAKKTSFDKFVKKEKGSVLKERLRQDKKSAKREAEAEVEKRFEEKRKLKAAQWADDPRNKTAKDGAGKAEGKQPFRVKPDSKLQRDSAKNAVQEKKKDKEDDGKHTKDKKSNDKYASNKSSKGNKNAKNFNGGKNKDSKVFNVDKERSDKYNNAGKERKNILKAKESEEQDTSAAATGSKTGSKIISKTGYKAFGNNILPKKPAPNSEEITEADLRYSEELIERKTRNKKEFFSGDRKKAQQQANETPGTSKYSARPEAGDETDTKYATASSKDKKSKGKEDATGPMPLNKYIAHAGICSRRDAAEIVREGKVTVNDQPATDPGMKIAATDSVKVNGKKVVPTKHFVYILLNKPKDFITTSEDPQGRKTVLDLIRHATDERVYPIGRLDRNTSGVLLFTNDGDLAQTLSHPKYENKKVYQVGLDKPLTKNDFEKIIEGIPLEDGLTVVDSLAYTDTKDKTQIGIEIHSGRNRIVRRIFEHLGYDVKTLDRVMYAGLTKKNVLRGKWRLLTDKEVRNLKHFNGNKGKKK